VTTVADQTALDRLDMKPAPDEAIEHLAKTVLDQRAHDHNATGGEDLYCLNLTSYLGERMGFVLVRLREVEADTIPVEDVRELLREIRTVLDVPISADRADREKRHELLVHRAAHLTGALAYFLGNSRADLPSTIKATRRITELCPVTYATYRTDEQPGGGS
jgi:hypothetical protein